MSNTLYSASCVWYLHTRNEFLQDAENRRAKQMWLAVQNIVDSIEFGKKGSCCIEGRRLPLAKQIKTIEQCAENDLFMKTLVAAMPKTSLVEGEYTKEDLKTRFSKVSSLSLFFKTPLRNWGKKSVLLISWTPTPDSTSSCSFCQDIGLNYAAHSHVESLQVNRVNRRSHHLSFL